MRRVVALVAAVVFATLLQPTPPAQGSTQVINVTFDGEITLWKNTVCDRGNPSLCAPRALWAPTSTSAACNPQCPTPPSKLVFWDLATPGGAPLEPVFKQAPLESVPCNAVTASGPAASCSIRGRGAIHLSGSPIPGPYCYGAFQGTTNVLEVTINGQETALWGTSVPPSPAPGVHTWPTMRWTVNTGGLTSDAGVATMTMAEPEGRCGLDPLNPVPMHRTEVSGTITWADPQ